jgi:PiT family inorganic phosphate transporter
MFGLSTGMFLLLISALLAACVFEFINGFHDTANAVATVIYTKSLKPRVAVVWSGIWNFIGVYFGGIAVAMGIMNLLPMEALVDQNIAHNVAMIFALIVTAVIWNISTWYLGIPCSSSHTMIGSIFGIGIAYMFISVDGSIALNWNKVIDAGLTLLISPVFGFGLSILLMYILKRVVKRKKFFRKPEENKKPPFWIRGLLVLTCTSVSYSHGSNDGQKGVGLIMIILIAILPSYFAFDTSRNPTNMIGNVTQIEHGINKIDTLKLNNAEFAKYKNIKNNIYNLKIILSHSEGIEGIPQKERFQVRKNIMQISKNTKDLFKSNKFTDDKHPIISKNIKQYIERNEKELLTFVEFAPWWVILMISMSLGLGTMFGWKRIVVTIGEKIGKTHLSYAQGASAEIVAASTIIASSSLGLPVSTTHVLSSGVAGTMVSMGGWHNLQWSTVKNILIAWVITIPVTIILSGGLFLLLRNLI